MSETTHQGSCQCGSVKFEFSGDISKGMTCNCSMCSRKGVILTFVPETNFKLLAGEDAQTEYLFNKHQIHHLFCRRCGVESFAKAKAPDGTPTVAVNIRCVEGVDLHAVQTQEFDGRSR
jgi:hypothetical protein